MTQTELKEFRRILEGRQAELGSGTQNREALAIETSPDELDRIQHATERDYAMGDLERKSAQLRAVNGALRRMGAGQFGVCAGCEEDISPRRLAAIPWASLCVVCQEAADRRQKATPEEIDVLEMAA